MQDIEQVTDVLGATYEAENLGDMHDVAQPRVGEQLVELWPLERMEAAGGVGLFLEGDRLGDPASLRALAGSVGRVLAAMGRG
ncbi:hypothetical protein [Actinomadura litoris]|uniref:hypothetical protein n=1 Tax=Actinomadura litoris TaxID=2678616 RepID=UPI001FA748B9|nr:hypothetical protein [Actinomadura litoris]